MTTHDRRLRDSSRVARLRAMIGSRTVLRAAVLVGFSGVAWLAGVAAAQADQIAGTASDDSTPSRLSAVVAPVVDLASAASEQAALTPVNQLESDSTSILDAPGELLDAPSNTEAPQAKPPADASADVTALDTIDTAVSGSTETADSLSLAPLAAASEPILGNLTAVTEGVGDELSGVTGPLAATTRPVDSVFTDLSAASPPAMLAPVMAPLRDGGTGPGLFPGSEFDVDNGVFNARAHGVADDSVESGHGIASDPQGEGDTSTIDGAYPRHDDAVPSSFPVRPDLGNTTSGAVPSGSSLHGPVPADNGVGSLASVQADRNAAVSRVTPSTAVFGQLPDHIADPAVSPD